MSINGIFYCSYDMFRALFLRPAYLLFIPGALGLALALFYLNATYQDFKERSVGMISYADLCGTAAFELKQLFFPSAQCVEPVWSMNKEDFEKSQREADHLSQLSLYLA